ncbi:MAG: DNA repair protein RadC [Gammaproteobacteria bacterium]|nr:DNA repair protein RadC [Gammaproteobacteria bacterium]
MAIPQWPTQERPRERLLKLGPKQLSDAELVAIFLRTGSVGMSAVDVARELLTRFGGLHELLATSVDEFCLQRGVGPTKYVQLQAVKELGLRLQKVQLQQSIDLGTSKKVGTYLQCEIGNYQREVFCLLLLDNQHRLLEMVELFQGTIDSANVYPREVVKLALAENAAAVILAHNHPSGVAEPSASDLLITQALVDALALVDIRILDHFVVGRHEWVSFADRGLI